MPFPELSAKPQPIRSGFTALIASKPSSETTTVQNQVVGAAAGEVMQRQNQNQVQKGIFPRQKAQEHMGVPSAAGGNWGRIAGPSLLTETPPTQWGIQFICGVGTGLCWAWAGQQKSKSCANLPGIPAQNASQPNCFFWASVKAWMGNLYWCAVSEIPFGFVLL